MRLIGRAALCGVALSVLGTAVLPADAAPAPLTVTASVNRTSFVSGHNVSVTLRVHNSGTTSASDVTADLDDVPAEIADTQPLGLFDNSGVTVPAGGTVTTTLAGHLASPGSTTVIFSGTVFDRAGNNVVFSAAAPVTVRTTTINGEVFGDANANGRADNGEGVAGVKVHFTYAYGQRRYSVTTGRGGRFGLTVPDASYFLDSSGSTWSVIPRFVTTTASARTLTLRAVKPLTRHSLKAALHLTKHTYAPHATVHVVLTLTNTGSTTLRGIGAECDHAGFADELSNDTRGWGELELTKPGVILAAHRTRTFDVTGRVPTRAPQFGDVVMECEFGYPNVVRGYRPDVSSTAKVPGVKGSLAGVVQDFPHGLAGAPVGVKNVRVDLVDPTTCPLRIRTATTDASGHFRLTKVPVGTTYKLYYYPPAGFKPVGGDPTNVEVIGTSTSSAGLQVAHGSHHVPRVPKTCRAQAS